MEKSRKPKIRFKGYNDDWEQRKLGELILEYKKTVDSSCTLPVLTSSKTEGVILQEEHFGRRQQHDITGYNVLPRSFCTYRNRSDGVDFTFNVNECCDMGIISKFYPVFYGNDNDTFFLSLVLNNSDEVVHEIAFTCIGTGQKVLSFLDLQKMSIRVPKQSEQKKISTYFKQLDDLITLHQRKLEKLMNVKKSMLEKMFPKQGSVVPEIRFCGFTDAWEQRKLSGILCEKNERTSDFNSFPLYSLTIENGITPKTNRYERSSLVTKTEDLFKIVNQNEFVTNPMNLRFGALGYNKNPHYISVSGYYDVFSIDNDKCSAFWNSYFKTISVMTVFDNAATGSLIEKRRVKYSTLKQISLLMPIELREKQKIGSFFEDIDELITLHQRKLEKLKNIKKSMLEKMFI